MPALAALVQPKVPTPGRHRAGLRARYRLIGQPLPPAHFCGYWATHLADIRYDPTPNPLYTRLRQTLASTELFVWTSIVDGLFAGNNFDPARICSPYGNYSILPCRHACTTQTWDFEPVMRRLLAPCDPGSGAVIDPNAIPAYPNCDGKVWLNARIDGHLDEPHEPARARLQQWLNATQGDQLLIVEIGPGFNTPSVSRWPVPHVVRGVRPTIPFPVQRTARHGRATAT